MKSKPMANQVLCSIIRALCVSLLDCSSFCALNRPGCWGSICGMQSRPRSSAAQLRLSRQRRPSYKSTSYGARLIRVIAAATRRRRADVNARACAHTAHAVWPAAEWEFPWNPTNPPVPGKCRYRYKKHNMRVYWLTYGGRAAKTAAAGGSRAGAGSAAAMLGPAAALGGRRHQDSRAAGQLY